ncbi:hypothetical protein GUJ93_ZPchr0014g47388 [Zizania palustris]|uniref:Uncharacterized protein n=1 Tax=Zizania palustris TaxID=103762 RepID=A0A8J5W0E6_ZIZPA|nr:hypothetical protein GUJ93_ZPchr0014g47388 [Zizania palustris]
MASACPAPARARSSGAPPRARGQAGRVVVTVTAAEWIALKVHAQARAAGNACGATSSSAVPRAMDDASSSSSTRSRSIPAHKSWLPSHEDPP